MSHGQYELIVQPNLGDRNMAALFLDCKNHQRA